MVTLEGAARQAEEDGCLMEVAFWTDLHDETSLGAVLEGLVGRIDWSRAGSYQY